MKCNGPARYYYNNYNKKKQQKRKGLRECLVCVFKQPFSVFKQHFTHFNALFHPHVFPQIFSNNNFQFLNTCTKRTLNFWKATHVTLPTHLLPTTHFQISLLSLGRPHTFLVLLLFSFSLNQHTCSSPTGTLHTTIYFIFQARITGKLYRKR